MACSIDLEIEEVRHLHAFGNHTIVGCHHRLMEIGMFHITAIDKEVITPTLLPGCLGFTHETRDGSHSGMHLYGQEVLIILFTKDISNTLTKIGGTEVEHLHPIVME